MEHMKERVHPILKNLRPALLSRNEAARRRKRRLAAMTLKDWERFRTHVAQSDIIYLTGLGGSAECALVPSAAAAAAPMLDAGASRQTVRILGA